MPSLVFILLLYAFSSTSSTSSEIKEVSTCHGLQNELKDPLGAELLLLTSDLHCLPNEWLEPIQITRNVILRGNQSEPLYRLDLTQLHPAIVIDSEALLTLDTMVVYNILLEHDVFALSFAKATLGSSISIMRSYVMQPECLSDIKGMLSKSRVHHLCGTWFVCSNDRVVYGLDEEMTSACSEVDQARNGADAVGDDGSIDRRTVVIPVSCVVVGMTLTAVLLLLRDRWHRHNADVESLSEREVLTTPSKTSNLSTLLSTRVVKVCGEYSVDLDHQLGVGGFGTVYAGSYQGTSAAVKVIKSWDVPKGQKLESEANFAVALEHPNVVRCLGTQCIAIKELFGEQHPQACGVVAASVSFRFLVPSCCI